MRRPGDANPGRRTPQYRPPAAGVRELRPYMHGKGSVAATGRGAATVSLMTP
ncbi:hypothetical protein KGA66_17525 [Actinocrinis puniceicyclus]|uniref:Uncharacterized protein n=1 Tax=Actinocrinis puniceicyclus TaxID=977794 RepID=A0A8J7WRW6_9ACTN|nr:hypothetical protein [Actinocrinis puniceicyclus]MBS2964862.1 hypothetical protein [Actinocrinis puniceicyclus]